MSDQQACTRPLTDAEKAKRYDLLVRLRRTYSLSFFLDKVGFLFDDDFAQNTVDEIIETMERDIERWKK